MIIFKKIILMLLILLIVSPLTILLLIYSPDEELPNAFQVENMDDNKESMNYFKDLDLRDLSDIKMSESEINKIINIYVEYGMSNDENIDVKYLYLDLKENRIEGYGYVIISKMMDFPMKIKLTAETTYSDGMLNVKIEKIKAGRVSVPLWLIKKIMVANEMKIPGLDLEDLSYKVDIDGLNPYSNIFTVKDAFIDEEYLHVKIELVNLLPEKFDSMMQSLFDVFNEGFDKIKQSKLMQLEIERQ
ncbi:MAG: hypothetical protein JW702_01150 [Clostridiales bacterium]|nr:hypothetical protein [Clostridiales bacterium]